MDKKILCITAGNMKSAELNERNYQFKTNIIMKTKTSILALTKAFFILLVMCCFFSCEQSQEVKDNIARRKVFENSETVNGYKISVIEYDSCEYLISGSGYSQMMTHKGNCKYCANRSLK
jgi:precorrin-2 methylase